MCSMHDATHISDRIHYAWVRTRVSLFSVAIWLYSHVATCEVGGMCANVAGLDGAQPHALLVSVESAMLGVKMFRRSRP